MLRKLQLASFFILSQVFTINASFAEETLLERGEYLTDTIVACGNCHTPKTSDAVPIDSMKFAGGFLIEEPVFKAYAPNITMDKETGIGFWTDEQIIRSIREGVRPDGSIIGPPMPFGTYRDISDRDIKAIVAYMRSVKPVRNRVPKSEYKIPLPSRWGPTLSKVAEVPKDDPLAYGKYVTLTLGHCTECHSPLVKGKHDLSQEGSGGHPFVGIFGLNLATVTANITPHKKLGIGNWSDRQIKTVITTGIRPDGRKLASVMGFSFYKNIKEEDLDAIVLYLRSLKALPEE